LATAFIPTVADYAFAASFPDAASNINLKTLTKKDCVAVLNPVVAEHERYCV
jgi:hypothetical protein